MHLRDFEPYESMLALRDGGLDQLAWAMRRAGLEPSFMPYDGEDFAGPVGAPDHATRTVLAALLCGAAVRSHSAPAGVHAPRPG